MVRSIMKDNSEDFETPTQGKTSEEADISPEGLEAAETLAKVLTQRTKTYTSKVKTGLRRKLDVDEVNSGDESIIPSPKKGQREGKAVLEEKSQQDALIAKRVQDELELSETQKNRMAQVQEAAKYYTEEDWDSSESARSDTEEDVEAYMDERVDEPSSEEFQMGSIPQGSTPAKIIKWQILKTGKKGAYQIIREDHTDVVYVNFLGLLNDLIRYDLKELYRLMMLKYGDSRPEEEYERVLWGDLKTMFDPPSIEDVIWSLTHQQKVLSWRYFHICAVHCLTLEAAHIYMLTEVKYPLPSRVCQAMLEKRLIGDRKDEVCYQLLKLIERQAQQQ
ncbi:hypothetical protein Tco_0637344 [Tanacetum coccineum]